MTNIYCLRDESGRIRYVGKTRKTAQQRLAEHIYKARRAPVSHRDKWISSMLKNGLIPGIFVLESASGEGSKEEIKWIAQLRADCAPLTNHTHGGEGMNGFLHSPVGKGKISDGLRKAWKTRSRISKLRGRKRPKSVNLKISASHFGILHSDATKEKLRQIRLGTKASVETKAKMSAERKGKTSIARKQHLAKIHASRIGVPLSAETRSRISAARIRRFCSKE